MFRPKLDQEDGERLASVGVSKFVRRRSKVATGFLSEDMEFDIEPDTDAIASVGNRGQKKGSLLPAN